jgi:putative ABC transport system permease protein
MFNRTSLFRIIIQVNASAELDAAADKATAILTERHGEEDITCLTQDAVINSFSAILTALTLALGGIAAISLSVSGIGIMNVMLVSVSERTREIGLLSALGAKKRQVLAVFLAEAIILSSAGGLAGLGAGWIATKVFGHIYPSFPVIPPVWAVVAAITVSIGVGGLFGVIPAIRATRLDPSRALAGR